MTLASISAQVQIIEPGKANSSIQAKSPLRVGLVQNTRHKGFQLLRSIGAKNAGVFRLDLRHHLNGATQSGTAFFYEAHYDAAPVFVISAKASSGFSPP